MVLHYIKIVYALILINMRVPEPDIVPAMVRYVRVNTLNVIAPPIMFGAVALVYAIVLSNIVVAVVDIVQEVEHLATANTKVATVVLFIVGMAVLAYIHTAILAQADTQHQAQA